MKKEEITALGITEEQAAKVLELHEKEQNAASAKLSEAETKLAAAQSSVKELTEKVKAFDGVDVEALKKAAADWETKYNADIAKAKIDSAVEIALTKAGAKDVALAKHLIDTSITPVDFRKPSSEPVRQSQAERQIILRGGTSWKQELCEVIDYAKQNAADMEEFQNILAQYSIEITRNTEKTIAYKHPQKSKAIRGEKLGQNYTKEAILIGIEEHNYRSTGFEYEEPDRSADFDRSAGDADIQSYLAEFSDGGEDHESGEEAFGERESEEYYRELEREAERRRNSAWER